jgi:hypothetical protein
MVFKVLLVDLRVPLDILIAVDKKGITMKKYLFGLGAMLVGAGLMFVLMHGEVRARGL